MRERERERERGTREKRESLIVFGMFRDKIVF